MKDQVVLKLTQEIESLKKQPAAGGGDNAMME